MANRIKLKGTSEKSFDIGLTNKQTFDATGLSANRTWVLPDSDGANGYVLSTDGSGVLDWIQQNSISDTQTPYFIPIATSFTVFDNKQVLFSREITVDGTLIVDGDLIQVNGAQVINDGLMPYYIPVSEEYLIPINKQALFAINIEIDGVLNIDGILVGV